MSESTAVNDQDIRARILQDLYARTRDGQEVLTSPREYATLLGIEEKLANFNMVYLVERNLAKGDILQSPNSTKRDAMIWGLTAFGVEAVEGRAGQNLSVNFSIINVNAPVTSSQIASGHGITQTQSIQINSFSELYRYLDDKLGDFQKKQLRPLVEELEADTKKDSVKPSTLRKIREMVQTWGPVGATIIEAVAKLSGL
jgi:hypothetical protein